MACRNIVDTPSGVYVIKTLDDACAKAGRQLCLPTFLGNNGENWEAIGAYIDEIPNDYTREAIAQQYNEMLLYFEWSTVEEKDLLAPIVKVEYSNNDEGHLPQLYFPKFEILVSEEEAFRFTDEDNLIVFALRANAKGISEREIMNFIEKVAKFCDSVGLDKADILYNASNLGYNPELGIRIVDYGLSENRGLLNY